MLLHCVKGLMESKVAFSLSPLSDLKGKQFSDLEGWILHFENILVQNLACVQAVKMQARPRVCILHFPSNTFMVSMTRL